MCAAGGAVWGFYHWTSREQAEYSPPHDVCAAELRASQAWDGRALPGRRFLLGRSPEEAGREVCLKTAWPPAVTALAGRHLE